MDLNWKVGSRLPAESVRETIVCDRLSCTRLLAPISKGPNRALTTSALDGARASSSLVSPQTPSMNLLSARMH